LQQTVDLKRATVHRRIQQAMENHVFPLVQEMQQLAYERYEAILTGVMPDAMRGDPTAVSLALQTIREQRNLFGLDAPQRVEARVSSTIEGSVQHHGQVEPARIFNPDAKPAGEDRIETPT